MFFDVVPEKYKKFYIMQYRVLCIAECSLLSFILLLSIINNFDNLLNIVIVSSPMVLIFTILCIQSYLNHRVLQSKVAFGDESIKIFYKKYCWREIRYNQIKKIEIKEISLSFYGPKFYLIGDSELKCLVISLSDEIEDIFDLEIKNFKNKNYFVMQYSEDMVNYLYRKT